MIQTVNKLLEERQRLKNAGFEAPQTVKAGKAKCDLSPRR